MVDKRAKMVGSKKKKAVRSDRVIMKIGKEMAAAEEALQGSLQDLAAAYRHKAFCEAWMDRLEKKLDFVQSEVAEGQKFDQWKKAAQEAGHIDDVSDSEEEDYVEDDGVPEDAHEFPQEEMDAVESDPEYNEYCQMYEDEESAEDEEIEEDDEVEDENEEESEDLMVTEMEDEEEKFDSSEEDDDIVDDVLTKNIVRESDSPAFKEAVRRRAKAEDLAKKAASLLATARTQSALATKQADDALKEEIRNKSAAAGEFNIEEEPAQDDGVEEDSEDAGILGDEPLEDEDEEYVDQDLGSEEEVSDDVESEEEGVNQEGYESYDDEGDDDVSDNEEMHIHPPINVVEMKPRKSMKADRKKLKRKVKQDIRREQRTLKRAGLERKVPAMDEILVDTMLFSQENITDENIEDAVHDADDAAEAAVVQENLKDDDDATAKETEHSLEIFSHGAGFPEQNFNSEEHLALIDAIRQEKAELAEVVGESPDSNQIAAAVRSSFDNFRLRAGMARTMDITHIDSHIKPVVCCSCAQMLTGLSAMYHRHSGMAVCSECHPTFSTNVGISVPYNSLAEDVKTLVPIFGSPQVHELLTPYVSTYSAKITPVPNMMERLAEDLTVPSIVKRWLMGLSGHVLEADSISLRGFLTAHPERE